jgi:transposase
MAPLLGVEKTVVESIEFDEGVVVASVRPTRRAAGRCGRCDRRSPWYDRGEGRRRWRALGLGTVQVWLEADAPRVNCRTHGATVRAVPWARHTAGHTRAFDQQAAWLATTCSMTAVVELMRVDWHRRLDRGPGMARRVGRRRPVRWTPADRDR